MDILEPAVALAWSDAIGDSPPNEDSRLIEFDEGNLLSLDRFPGEDVVENGGRAAWGLTWTRMGTAGEVSRLTFGRVARIEREVDFSAASGLDGTMSDWLLAGQLDLTGGFTLDARAVWDPGAGFGKSAAQVLWSGRGIDLAAAYVWLPADEMEDRDEAIAEWTLEGDWQITDRWSVSFDTRYDVSAQRAARAGLGIGWRNECVTVDLSVSRRYTSTTDVDPSTDFGLAVNLNGFSAGRSAAVTPGECRG